MRILASSSIGYYKDKIFKYVVDNDIKSFTVGIKTDKGYEELFSVEVNEDFSKDTAQHIADKVLKVINSRRLNPSEVFVIFTEPSVV